MDFCCKASGTPVTLCLLPDVLAFLELKLKKNRRKLSFFILHFPQKVSND